MVEAGSTPGKEGVKEFEGVFSLCREDSHRVLKSVFTCPKVKTKANGLALLLGDLGHSQEDLGCKEKAAEDNPVGGGAVGGKPPRAASVCNEGNCSCHL